MKKLGDNLKKTRTQAGITADALALSLGVTRVTVYRWESGEREPDLATLFKIASILDVSVGYLIGETDVPVSVKEPEEAQEKPLQKYDIKNLTEPYEIIEAITEINTALNKEGDRFSDAEAKTAETLLCLCIDTLKREKDDFIKQETA